MGRHGASSSNDDQPFVERSHFRIKDFAAASDMASMRP
jgi:hypothetical protein